MATFINYKVTVYFISGLGADRKAFQKLKLPGEVQVRHIEWVEPIGNESLADYCCRLSACIDASEEFIIVGLSFGGMVAIEIAKVLKPKQVIIISSISTRQELPFMYQLIGRSGLHQLAPSFLFRKPNVFMYWFFGAKTEGEKRLFKHFLYTSSPLFLKWAIDKILRWKNAERPGNLFHIHGTADRVLPVSLTKADVKVKGGRHFMVYSKADIVSKILNERFALNKNYEA
jgi:pimeloyl-ACP methyl ester carboxylesterase